MNKEADKILSHSQAFLIKTIKEWKQKKF